ncbi:hypothetical protein CRE_08611 [Caenorhabditis remanei]|uniref:Uncharacterized protein n=1 Tax=Caenorhabditis remanei TaxID=31234 RepID=E3NJI5_CAERE|nr:hypothetical protein CRE_08612 [Caenorhabditis remanei]EFP00868.1 hypothetical protein CRE_08611 [Caenorhabditis remanei]
MSLQLYFLTKFF